jgi:hypothetical protein
VQLEYGTTATDYVPHQEYTKEINLPIENLYNKNNVSVTGSNNQNILFSTTLKPNTTYTYNVVDRNYATIYLYDSNNTRTRTLGNTQSTHQLTFTTTDSEVKGEFTFFAQANVDITTYDFTGVQLEKGTKANSFTPFGTTPIEVGSIGEYEDEFFKNTTDSEYYDSTLEQDKWYLKKRIQKTIITSENKNIIEGYSTQYNHPRVLIVKSSLGYQSSWLSGVCLMNKYKEITSSSEVNSGVFGTNFVQSSVVIWNDDFTDLATAQNTLIGTEIYIIKATPTNILLNETLQETLDSFYSMQEQTNISQENNDLPFVIKASAIRDISNL